MSEYCVISWFNPAPQVRMGVDRFDMVLAWEVVAVGLAVGGVGGLGLDFEGEGFFQLGIEAGGRTGHGAAPV